MMKDGHIDQSEIEKIRDEAKRLHLSEEEVNALITQIHQALEREAKFAHLPINQIAAKPEFALEHYKSMLGDIRQLGLLVDLAEFDRLAVAKGRLSADELALWRHIQNRD
jgi:hypothetical protein